jgi:sec-independent protein translocase protein TatC
MASPDDPQGAKAPDAGAPSESEPVVGTVESSPAEREPDIGEKPGALVASSSRGNGGSNALPPPSPPEDDEEDEGMLRMSFLEHLEELRTRLIRMLMGIAVAFLVSLTFSNQLWLFVSEPAVAALRQLGYKQPTLTQITPMEVFNVVWVKLPILSAIFLASPWVLYQIWAFIAPGLYKKERRWAAPFVICSAGLFILGGVFAYFVAFRFGLTFLLGLGRGSYITPMVSVTEYFDLFVNVMLGVGLVFELPVLIFFLTLLRIITPKFLISNSRYAILGIVILAAIVTPTPDVFNLMLFATPMCVLFYFGIFASYLLVIHRENRKFPWAKVFLGVVAVIAVLAAVVFLAITRYGYHFLWHWPFLTR